MEGEGNELINHAGGQNIGGQRLFNKDQVLSVAKPCSVIIVILAVNIFLLMLLAMNSMFLRLESSSLDQSEYLLIPSNTSFFLSTPKKYLNIAGVKFSFVNESLAKIVNVYFILREPENPNHRSIEFKMPESNGAEDVKCRVKNGQPTTENCYIVRQWKSKPLGTLLCKSYDTKNPSTTYLVWEWFHLNLTKNEQDNFYNFPCPKEANKLEKFPNCSVTKTQDHRQINVGKDIFINDREPYDDRIIVSMQFCLKPDSDNDDIGYRVNFTEQQPSFGCNDQYNTYAMGRDTDAKLSEVVVPLVPGVDKSIRIIVDGQKTEPIKLKYKPMPSANQIIERHHVNVDFFIHNGSIGILCASTLFFLCFNGGVIIYVRIKCRRQDNHNQL